MAGRSGAVTLVALGAAVVWVLAAGPAMLTLPRLQAAQTQTPALIVISRDGRRPMTITPFGGQDYVALDEVNRLFGTTSREDRLAGGFTVTARGRTIVLTADQNVVSVAGRLVSLSAPVVRRDDRWYAPLDFLPRALAVALDLRLDLRRPTRLLIVGDLRVPRVVARVDAGTSDVAVTFEITPNTEAKVAPQPGRLLVQFEADALDLTLPSLPPQSFLASLAPGEAPTSVALGTGPRYAAYRVSGSQPDAGSGRLTVTLLPAATDAPAPAPAPAARDERPGPDTRSPVAALRTVVLDPGHGGDELGTQGVRGTLEKEITLAVARRLRTLIESRLGLKVFLTRDDDRTLSLDDRAAYANSHKADVFLSIHANASVRPEPRGAEVYYLSIERADAEARRRAEDAAAVLPAFGGGTRAVDLILWETAQTRYLEQSAMLAGYIAEALRTRVEMSPRGVQQASLRVLVGANMPAALVEVGYLSNPDQEAALASADYQDRIAEALLDAIVRFRAAVER